MVEGGGGREEERLLAAREGAEDRRDRVLAIKGCGRRPAVTLEEMRAATSCASTCRHVGEEGGWWPGARCSHIGDGGWGWTA